MDRDAARKARRNSYKSNLYKENLAEAYTDEEANPPEWLDLASTITAAKTELRAKIALETAAFVDEPDIRRAIARRDRAADELSRSVTAINRMVTRLNLIAPHQRFTQTGLDADELLRPLFRSARTSS
jgi:hypothetical protein